MLKSVHHAAQPIIDEFWQQLATETVNPHNKDGGTVMLVYFPIHLLIYYSRDCSLKTQARNPIDFSKLLKKIVKMKIN